MVHLRVAYEGVSFRTIALIDSGATCTFLPKDIADILDLPHEESQEVIGAGGVFMAYKSKVDLAVIKGKSPIIEFPNCPVLVPEMTDGIPYAILGRDTIFQKVQITFKEKDEKMILKSY